MTVLRLLLVADNGNKPRKGEGTWKKEDTYTEEKERWEIKREEERGRIGEEGGKYGKEERGEKTGMRIETRERHTLLWSGRKRKMGKGGEG